MKQSKQYGDEQSALTAVQRGIDRRVKELSMKNKNLKIICSTLCATLLISGASLGLTAHPAVAAQLEDVPVIGWVARVLTLEHVTERSKTIDADLTIPKLEGMKDTALQERINREIEADADTLLSSAREAAKELEGYDGAMPVTIHSDYTVHRTKDILSFDIVVTHIGASSAQTMKQYNIDLKTQKRLTLADLFTEGTDYKSVLNKLVLEQIEKDPDRYFQPGEVGAFKSIDENTQFFIDKDGHLMIAFDEYEIAPGASGSPQFEISKADISPLVKPEYQMILQ